jgi:hypothetical protein
MQLKDQTISEYVTLQQAARILDCSCRHIHALGRSGDLTVIDIRVPGRKTACWRVKREDLDAWLAGRVAAAQAINEKLRPKARPRRVIRL